MKSPKIYHTAASAKGMKFAVVDYPPSAEELEGRMSRFKARTRVLNATSAGRIWGEAAKMEVEAGGEPMFAEHLDMGGDKFTI